MQSFSSRPAGSSEIQITKTSPTTPTSRRSSSAKIRRASSDSSDSVDSKLSKDCERKPSTKSQSFQEKQRTMRVSDTQQQWDQLQEDLRRAKEERALAIEELTELKKMNEGFIHSKDMIKMLETEAEKAKDSEGKMLLSLFSQTKQLEQTKILLEEVRLEMRNLQENAGGSARLNNHSLEKNNSLASNQPHEEIRKIKNELRLALQAEEKSKKAMDDLAIALKEVTTEASHGKEEIALKKSELEKTALLLRITEQKLRAVMEGYAKLKLEFEESAVVWKEKEDIFINCIKISEEDMSKKDEEISKLSDAHRNAREESSKLRDIMKQAVNEATVVKESLEIARYENYELNVQLSQKHTLLQKIRQDYESIKISETAALDSVRELKNLLASDSNKASNILDVESFRQSATIDDRKISKSVRKFSSDRWTNLKPWVQNGHRHSVGESDMLKGLVFEKAEDYGNKGKMFGSSSLFSDDRGLSTVSMEHLEGVSLNGTDNEKQKNKKTALRRFGDALRRRSFGKS